MNRDRIAAAVTHIERKGEASHLERMAEVRSMGHVPVEVGPEVTVAPARGPVRVVEMRTSYPKGEDGFEIKPSGFLGRKTLCRADSFDLMAAKASRHKKAAPFSPGQVAMGRLYRDLCERHACAGVQCSSFEGRSGGGSGGGFMDAVLRDGERIDLLRNRIGAGAAMVVRRVRSADRGSRVTIMDRRLVDIVCLEDGTITDVLRQHGWSNDSKIRMVLMQALGSVLDRMMGPVRNASLSATHFGQRCSPVF